MDTKRKLMKKCDTPDKLWRKGGGNEVGGRLGQLIECGRREEGKKLGLCGRYGRRERKGRWIEFRGES